MPVNLKVGDKVLILAGDAKGCWGTIQLINDDEYHVLQADNETELHGNAPLLFDRKEIRKPRGVN